ncbi:MAG: HEAT repeat domain-containing protein, partial [Chloroflexi bacterium]|nr:HEAT repeat domain-containing protein [Chloroflexota bacterium]
SAILNDDDLNVRDSAASALGQLGQPSENVLQALTSAILNDDDWNVRSSALRSLGAVVAQ